MASTSAASGLNISLEGHLADSLRPLLGLLPSSLATELKQVLEPTHHTPHSTPLDVELSKHALVRTIPYALLAAISKWARTPDAEHAMSSHEPPLRVQDYSMVALLAGTRTNPERTYPTLSTPSADDQTSHTRELGDRRAVTAVVNALLSVGGAGIATWWAAGRLSWRDEWKVLLGLSVAILVASSEALLYLIWENRRNQASAIHPKRFRGVRDVRSRAAQDKKRDPDSLRAVPEGDDLEVQNVATTTATVQTSATAKGLLRERIPVRNSTSDFLEQSPSVSIAG
ncbi:hypothetical protein BD311DRAFT_760706 [Dichomitus squalens]|uniref:Endoplasmic reticulum-based factor for assembly of V-ATPase-domain-containing protein n=1 Tax=Dichomitus squalens TaxID=114155 RepID=A0A4Q9MIB2_9APHY|nr:hypothetical protein BD311DRAFT_760706 [Dichomitus squalens]